MGLTVEQEHELWFLENHVMTFGGQLRPFGLRRLERLKKKATIAEALRIETVIEIHNQLTEQGGQSCQQNRKQKPEEKPTLVTHSMTSIANF